MVEENKDQEFRSKNKDETINYSIEEIKQNELISKRPKNICTVLSYIKQLLILASTVADVFPFLLLLLQLLFLQVLRVLQ